VNIVRNLDDPNLFSPWFAGPPWDAWRVVLKGAFALPMSGAEIELFRTLADRDPPTSRVRELWIIAGRRCGKDSVASVIAAQFAGFGDYLDRLRPGEKALVMCLAVDRDQAKIVLNYTRSYFNEIAELGEMVTRETANGLELSNGAEIAIHTNSFRAVRGRTIACVIFDEVAFWKDENSASPDKEVYNAVGPGLVTLPGSMLIAISSPYRRSGLLFEKWRRHYGRDGDVLVIKAPSTALNPTLDQALIDRALDEDPEAAGAEWLAEFRSDLADFVDRAVVEAAVIPGRFELPPVARTTYSAFTDPSGGSSDAFTLAIAHSEDAGGILDCIREVRPPFSPEAVVAEFAETLKSYSLYEVTGDRYAGEWPRERFRERGINYNTSERTKSDIYRELLPLLNSGKVELLDNPRLLSQLCGLERRTARGGRDSIDHGPGAHDDVVNAAAGALVAVAAGDGVDYEMWRRLAGYGPQRPVAAAAGVVAEAIEGSTDVMVQLKRPYYYAAAKYLMPAGRHRVGSDLAAEMRAAGAINQS
jgi:hypothetical protein